MILLFPTLLELSEEDKKNFEIRYVLSFGSSLFKIHF